MCDSWMVSGRTQTCRLEMDDYISKVCWSAIYAMETTTTTTFCLNHFVSVWVALKRAVLSSIDDDDVVVGLVSSRCGQRRLLGRRVLGDGLGSFADGVLGQLTGQEKTNSGLDFATGDRRATVVVSET